MVYTRNSGSAAEYYERLFSAGIEDFYFGEPDIRTIQSPTLVLWTDKNPIHGVDAAERLHQLVEELLHAELLAAVGETGGA